MNILTLRTAIIEDFKTNTSAKSVYPSPGRFDLKEIKKRTFKAPAIWIAALRIKDAEFTGSSYQKVAIMAAYVVTQPKAGETSDDQAIELSDQIIGRLMTVDFGAENPKRINAENLYTGAFGQSNISMWAVTWEQKIITDEIMPPEQYTALNDFERFHADFDIAPEETPEYHEAWLNEDYTNQPDAQMEVIND